MKKNVLMLVVFTFFVFTASFAQVSATPEVPKNYKPQPKELLPIPGELTDEMIFPVLGKYEYTDKDGNISNVTISRDADNKGVVWINGMPLGKFKADLKASPSTYKIPAQKTLQNDMEGDADAVASADSAVAADSKPAARFSGKSLKEGTLIYDSVSNKLYVNVGSKYNEEDPAAIFPEITAVTDTTVVMDAVSDDSNVATTSKKPAKTKEPVSKGTTYILTKVIEGEAVSPADTQAN
ncbi:MAG: hypothetical protein QM640_01385 [Niabella sp.]